MKCEFLPPAQAELEDAVHYYDVQQKGLGDQFAREVARTIQRILKHPRAGRNYRVVHGDAGPIGFRMA